MDDDGAAVMQYYDAEGKRVKEGSAAAVVQYLSTDPNRPDAKPLKGHDSPRKDKIDALLEADAKATKAAPEDKAVKAAPEDK